MLLACLKSPTEKCVIAFLKRHLPINATLAVLNNMLPLGQGTYVSLAHKKWDSVKEEEEERGAECFF